MIAPASLAAALSTILFCILLMRLSSAARFFPMRSPISISAPAGRFRFRLLACALCVLATGLASARADAPAASPRVQLGIAGKLKVGSWTPISVELPAPPEPQARLFAVTTDFENNEVETPLTAVAPATLTGLIQVGRLEGQVRILQRDGDSETTLAEIPVAPESDTGVASFRQGTEFWGVLGSTARFADAAREWTDSVRLTRGPATPAPAVSLAIDWTALPDDIDAWDSLDVLVVGGDAYQIPAAANELLRSWVERGGRVLFLLGGAARSYQQSPIAAWSPIRVQGALDVRSLEMVNARVERSVPLRLLARSVPAAHLSGNPEGTLPGPVVIAKPYGFGFVTAFAFDFEERALAEWEDQTTLLRQLVMPASTGPARMMRESDVASTGITDLASQLASGLDRFEQVHRPTFRGVMAWTALWLLVLFPLDYLLVHKLLKRPHLTWITLPLLIATATLLASRSAMAGNTAPLTVNQIDLLDYSSASSTARVRSWMSFYSGETARYDVRAESAVAGPARLGWNAKPEEGLRGLYRQGGINFGAPSYETSADHTEIRDLPVRVWSSYSLAADATRALGDQPPFFESSLSESDAGRLQGDLQHHLPGPLREWIVFYKNFAYYPVARKGELQIADWQVGQRWRPGLDGQPMILKSFLQGRRELLVKGQGKDFRKDQVASEVRPYDPLEFDPPRLFRMLSFHEAAAGSTYTGLANAPLSKLDLSRTVEPGGTKALDHAVILGRIDAPLMNYQIDGTVVAPAASWTFVRAIVPVKSP